MRRTFRRMPLLAAGIARYFDSQSLFKLSLLSCVKTPIASADLGRSEAVRRTSVASLLAYVFSWRQAHASTGATRGASGRGSRESRVSFSAAADVTFALRILVHLSNK